MTAPVLLGLDPVHGEYVTRVRLRFGRLTPWRLGMEEGATGRLFDCPYREPTARRLWREGFDAARRDQQDQQEHAQ